MSALDRAADALARDGAGEKEKFSFTDPDVPLFGREYQETKQRANAAMEKLRKAMEKAPPGKGKDAGHSSSVIREARELIRERERAAGPMTRAQKLLWLEDNMTEVPRGTSRHDIAEILDLL